MDIFVSRNNEIIKVISGPLLYQLRSEKVFSTQKVKPFSVSMKHTAENIKYLFMQGVFLFTKQPSSLLPDNKVHMSLLRLRYLYEIVFANEGFVYEIYYFIKHFF